MTCKDCKFFVQGEGHSGTCQKRPFRKCKSGQIVKKPDGTPIKFVVFWGTSAWKKNFERKDTNFIRPHLMSLTDLILHFGKTKQTQNISLKDRRKSRIRERRKARKENEQSK